MEKILQQFTLDRGTKDAVEKYLIQHLKTLAGERAFERQDVSGIADAHEIIKRAFVKLDKLYLPKKNAPESKSME